MTTIYISDDFSGSGVLSGAMPDVGTEWFGSSSLAKAGGQVQNADSFIGAVNASSTDLPDVNTKVRVSFSLTTTGVIPTSGTFVDVATIKVVIAGREYVVRLHTQSSGSVYRLEFNGNTAVIVTLTANTTYEGALTISNATQRMVFMGVTQNRTDPYIEYGEPLNLEIGTRSGFLLGPVGVEDQVVGAAITAPKATLKVNGGGNASLNAPTPALTATASPTAGPSGITMIAPSPKLLAFGGATSAIASPAPALLSAGRSSIGDNDFTYTAPSALLSARGGANARLTTPSPALSITATFTNFGKASISAPSATLSAAGTVSGVGQAALTFSDPYKLIGYSGAVASITLTGGYTVQAQSTAGSIGGAAITCPLFELSASGTAQNYGSANLLAPAARLGAQAQAWLKPPGFVLTAIGSATITATYEAYAVNLLHRNTDSPVDETTRYTNFPFTHVVRYKNSYYGANSTGLYLLEGTTDNGAAIPWEFKTTITDFESPMGKTAVSAYFAGRMGPEATVGIHLGESGDESYSHTTPRGPAAKNYRQVFGLGLKARYYALSVAGEGVMELDAVEFNNKTLTRRI